MIHITQDVSTWFGTDEQSLFNYYQDEFKVNTTNGFKAPRKMVRQYNNFATQADINKAINAIGNIYIQGIVHLKYQQLTTIPFAMLEEDTRELLKQAICEAIQFALLNDQVYERVNSSTITTNNFTLNTDTTSWMLTMDMFGKMAWNLIQNSGIDEYEWIEAGVIYHDTQNRNTKIIGRAYDELNDIVYEKVKVN